MLELSLQQATSTNGAHSQQSAHRGVALALIFLCMFTVKSRAQVGGAPPATPDYGRHFILLIDDSGGMNLGKRRAIGSYLPSLLFGGIPSGGQTLPGFDPSRDRVSMVFFTILKNPGGCSGGRRAMSADLDDMFELVNLRGVTDSRSFADQLVEQLSRGCRWGGDYSPIAISQLLVLPFLQKSLPVGELHSQTILITATDGEFNASAGDVVFTPPSPNNEFILFSQKGVNIASAQSYLGRLNRQFELSTPPNWLITYKQDRLFFLMAEVRPHHPPESEIQYLNNAPMEPYAVSGRELRYALRSQSLGDIQVLPKRSSADYEFKPLWLRSGFQDPAGQPWRIGNQQLPRAASPLLLQNCGLPQCREKDGVLGVSLFDVNGARVVVAPDDPEPDPGRIRFRVGFNYRTELYDHLYVETPEQAIATELGPPLTLPNFFFFLPAKQLSRSDLVAQYRRDDDGVTTPEEARNRLQGMYNLIWVGLAMALVAATLLIALYFFLTAYQRRFRPNLKWLPSPEVVVDFNRPAASRLLVGTLKVVNDQPVPWFGRLLNNNEQPTRQAEVSLDFDSLQAHGLEIAGSHPIGFVSAGDTPGNGQGAPMNGLERTIKDSVSDGKQIHVFLAADTIRDYPRARTGDREAAVSIDLKTEMAWMAPGSGAMRRTSMISRVMRRVRSTLAVDTSDSESLDVTSQLIVKPEEPRKPHVTYTPAEGRLHFSKGTEIVIGHFVFRSQALHRFAQPFVWGDYKVETYKDNRPLSGEPIRLDTPRVTVLPQAEVLVPVLIVCDGVTILNPDPATAMYTFTLIGDFDADSSPGPYAAMLYRDPARAEIELTINHRGVHREIFWTPDGCARQRLLLADGSGADERDIDAGLVTLDERFVEFDRQTPAQNLTSITVGNSAIAGAGLVAVDLHVRITGDDEAKRSVVMAHGRPVDDLVGVYDSDEKCGTIHVNEGEPPQTRDVRFHPGLIQRITGARIEANRFGVEVDLKIHVRTDQGDETIRALTLRLPIGAEQAPGLNWLAIDFGTSAIAVALGTGDNIVQIPLQDVKVDGGISLGDYDDGNQERDHHHLLPSWVICDADLRTSQRVKSNPGFPGYFDAGKKLSLTPGEADFIGLPALSRQLSENPERVIYSLKSWLAKSARNIKLQSPIEYRDDSGTLIRSDTLPLDRAVESGFAALADAYLFDPTYRADQIVLTHPNTFTERHKELLHDIALRAFGKPERFGIPLPERIQLISESDAVAYYYCTQQMRRRPRQASERILVYDFGAGTLDLSLIDIDWKSGTGTYPTRWEVQGRIGVPVAGNHIDEVLARLVDQLLGDRSLSGAEALQRQYHVVAGSFKPGKKQEHRAAIVDLWEAIREAKHQWDGRSPMNVKVGSVGTNEGLVVYKRTETVRDALPTAPPEDVPGFWEAGSSILLSIPARNIHDNPRMSTFIGFVTATVIEELLHAANGTAESVDTVIVSGRGALWPGLRDHVRDRFPRAYKPGWESDSGMDDAGMMKDAVVRGAIARQDLLMGLDDAIPQSRWQPKLGVLINHDEDLITEDDWDEPIDLSRSPTFRVVQINLRNPSPREDAKSLRKHFYIDLTDQVFRRVGPWARTRELWIRKEMTGGKLAVYLEDRDKTVSIPIFMKARSAEAVTAPPWPVGSFLLDPNE